MRMNNPRKIHPQMTQINADEMMIVIRIFLLCKFGGRFKICPQRTGLHAVGVCRDLIMRV